MIVVSGVLSEFLTIVVEVELARPTAVFNDK